VKLLTQPALLAEHGQDGVAEEFLQGGEIEGLRGGVEDPQGILAEYERSKILERTRRGRMHKARQGVLACGPAPYGYRHVPARDGVPAHLEIDPHEAEVVRQIFDWLVKEELSCKGIAQRLQASPWRTRKGGPWRDNMLGYMVKNESYTGRRHYNKTMAAEPRRRRNPGGYVKNLKSSHLWRPREEWIAIPVPRIIDDETFHRATEQMKVNAGRCFRNLHGKNRYLLRSLVRCGACGAARTGRTARTNGNNYPYYTCSSVYGTPAPGPPCSSRSVRADELDRLVWEEVKRLLSRPEEIMEYLHERYGTEGETVLEHTKRKLSELERSLVILKRQERRLVDAYQADVIELKELNERRSAIQKRRAEVETEIKRGEQVFERDERQSLVEEGIASFAKRLQGALEEVTFEEKQKIIRLLVEGISVHAGHVEIRYVVPVSGNLQLQPRRPKPPALAGKRQFDLVPAVGAPYPGEAPVGVAACEVVDDLVPVPLPGAVALGEAFRVDLLEIGEVIADQLVEGALASGARSVDCLGARHDPGR